MSQTKIQILLGVRHENVQESFKNFETEPDRNLKRHIILTPQYYSQNDCT